MISFLYPNNMRHIWKTKEDDVVRTIMKHTFCDMISSVTALWLSSHTRPSRSDLLTPTLVPILPLGQGKAVRWRKQELIFFFFCTVRPQPGRRLTVSLCGVSFPFSLPLPFSLLRFSSCVTSAGVKSHTAGLTQEDFPFLSKHTTPRYIK